MLQKSNSEDLGSTPEYKKFTYEQLSAQCRTLATRAYLLVGMMYNRLTLVENFTHKQAVEKIKVDHSDLPGFSARNIRRYLPLNNPKVPRRLRTSRPKGHNIVIETAFGNVVIDLDELLVADVTENARQLKRLTYSVGRSAIMILNLAINDPPETIFRHVLEFRKDPSKYEEFLLNRLKLLLKASTKAQAISELEEKIAKQNSTITTLMHSNVQYKEDAQKYYTELLRAKQKLKRAMSCMCFPDLQKLEAITTLSQAIMPKNTLPLA